MTNPYDNLDWLTADSEMGKRLRSKDWSATPLGPAATWPRSIKTAVSICLNSRFPMILWLGPELRIVYNDAYIPFLGDTKHPVMLGATGREAWGEIWDDIGPMHEQVAQRKAISVDHFQMFFARRVPREEVYVCFGFSPILGEDGVTVDGVFCACTETTEKIFGERRLATLRDLAAPSPTPRTVEIACQDAVNVLRGNHLDIPFAAIYLLDKDGSCAHRAAVLQQGDGPSFFPAVQPLADDPGPGAPWPFALVAATGRYTEVSDLPANFGIVASGPWPDPVKTALVLPLAAPTQDRPEGFVILGVGPRRVLDADYRDFLELVARSIATNLANARAFEAERRRAEALAEIDRSKTVFFSNVSHEFRTPLTLILSPLEEALAQSTPGTTTQLRELLQIAHRNSLRLLRLVNTLLDFSRVEAGRVHASYEPTDLAMLTIDIASNFRSACERAGLVLEVDCPTLPAPIYVDRDMWEKIVLNLVSNAFKFTLHGRIGVMLLADGPNILFAVSDTGVGIPPDELPRVFERFHRIEGQRGRTHEGTGIGLALVHDLVRLHGGDISVKSTPGVGTTFSVTIPFGNAHLPADQVNRSLPQDPVRPGARPFVEEAMRWLPGDVETATDPEIGFGDTAPGCTEPTGNERACVLLADDNADMRDYVCHLLSNHWEVEAVADGQAALDAARRRKPDLVLSDVMMPRLDGMTLLSILRRDPILCDVPVILLSARANQDAEVEGLESGADDYLVKPFSAQQLVARVGSCLALARQRAERAASMERFDQLSARLAGSSDLPSLHEILDATMELQGAESGNIQLYDQETETLEIVAQRGFEPEFLKHFKSVTANDGSACGRALKERRRLVIADVLDDPDFAPHRHIATAAGFRAVQSTPLYQRGSGALVGVLSTHFREPQPRFDRAVQSTDVFAQLAADVIASRLSDRRLRTSQLRLEGAVDLAQLGSYRWDPRANVLEMDSRARAMWGLPSDASIDHATWRGAIDPDDCAQFDAALARSIDRQHGGIFEAEIRVLGVADRVKRWIATRGSASFEDDGAVAFLGVALDITARKQTEQANLLLISELQHRTRNLLGVVNAVASETHDASSSLDEFFQMFSGRIAALSRVQDLLSRVDFQPTTISELVHLELRALGAEPDGQRVTVKGPDVALPVASVQILALALHELATNARKHGALAAPAGRLTVSWNTASNHGGKRSLVIGWREFGVGGGDMLRPVRRGFGRTLIEEALPYQLDAQTQLEFGRDGICCFVTIGLEQTQNGAWQ